MRKITFLLGCFVATLGTVYAQDVQASTVNELLERMETVENKIGAESENLFTQEERFVLQDHFNSNNTENPFKSLVAGDVYAHQLSSLCNDRGFGTFPLTGPYNINYITSTTTKFYGGDQDDAGNFYGVRSDTMDENGFLVKIDPETGAESEIGNLNMESPHVVTGIAWNTVNQTWYVLSSNSDFNRLYTVDVETAALTTVGSGALASRLGIWLAIDNAGNGYTTDIGTNELFTIDLSTGTATLVGSIGVQLRNAQDADFDPATGTLYAAGYLGGGVSRFYSVDTTTGSFTNLGSMNNGCGEFGFVSISGETAGVSENSLNDFSFYPNPSSGILNLKSLSNIESVSIYNLLGQQVINSRINATDFQLDVSFLNTGAYILKVEANGEVGTYKFLKN